MARFAAASVGEPAAKNTTLELGGPEAISPVAVVRIFERVSRGAFEVTHVPVEASQGKLAAATDPMERSFAGLMLSLATASAIDMRATLEVFGLNLRTVEEHARSVIV